MGTGTGTGMTLARPLSRRVEWESFRLEGPDKVKVAMLSDLAGVFLEGPVELLEHGDRRLYEFAQVTPGQGPGHLAFGVARLKPGKVGREYHMTQGHFHAVRETAEVYFCLAGEGVLLCEAPGEGPQELSFTPGVVGYVPPGWAHRVVNTGSTELIFLAVVDAGAGHEYGVEEVFTRRFLAPAGETERGDGELDPDKGGTGGET